MRFNWKEWNHGYTGVLLLVIGLLNNWVWLWIIGIILILDEIGQILWWGQYSGPIHWLYIKTLYRIPFIKKFDTWLYHFLKRVLNG